MIDLFLKSDTFSSNMITNELIIGDQKVDLGNGQLVSNWSDISYRGVLKHFILHSPSDNVSKKVEIDDKIVNVKLPYKESVILDTINGPISISVYCEGK